MIAFLQGFFAFLGLLGGIALIFYFLALLIGLSGNNVGIALFLATGCGVFHYILEKEI